MTGYLTCPRCGGRLCVDPQYPDYVFCDTCSYPEPDEQEDAEGKALAAWRGWEVAVGAIGLFATLGAVVFLCVR